MRQCFSCLRKWSNSSKDFRKYQNSVSWSDRPICDGARAECVSCRQAIRGGPGRTHVSLCQGWGIGHSHQLSSKSFDHLENTRCATPGSPTRAMVICPTQWYYGSCHAPVRVSLPHFSTFFYSDLNRLSEIACGPKVLNLICSRFKCFLEQLCRIGYCIPHEL